MPGPGALLASSNGGRTWSRRLLPPPARSRSRRRRGAGSPRSTAASTSPTTAGEPGPPPPFRPRAAFRSTLPLAELPTFSDPTHAALPVTFRRGTRAVVSFLTSRDGGTTWRTAAAITGRAAPQPPAAFPRRSPTQRTGSHCPTAAAASSASRTASPGGAVATHGPSPRHSRLPARGRLVRLPDHRLGDGFDVRSGRRGALHARRDALPHDRRRRDLGSAERAR